MPRACLKALEPCPLLANPCRLLVTSVAAQRGAAAPVLCSALSSPPTLPVHLSLACQAEAGGQPFLAGRRLHLNPLTCCWSSLLASLPALPASACVTRDRELPGVGELALGGVTLREREAAIMAWRSRLGEAGDTSLELSLGLPAYFAKPPSGLDAGEEPGDAAAAKGSDGSKSRVRPAAAAAPVVGWPPVRSFRRNLASSRQSPQSSSARHHGGGVKDGGAKGSGAGEGGREGGFFVKINMDGVPIGRKVDLTAYGGYAELSAAVGKLFRGLLAAQRDPAAAGAVSSRGGEEEVDADEPVIGGDYTLVYEDEEGDRVLVGDVPWEMFVATAKRLRVLKSSDLLSSLRAGGSRKRASADC